MRERASEREREKEKERIGRKRLSTLPIAKTLSPFFFLPSFLSPPSPSLSFSLSLSPPFSFPFSLSFPLILLVFLSLRTPQRCRMNVPLHDETLRLRFLLFGFASAEEHALLDGVSTYCTGQDIQDFSSLLSTFR